VEIVADNLSVPTGFAFLDDNNMLVLKRYTTTYYYPLGGLTTVNLISNGTVRKDPVLTVLSGLCDIHNPLPGCNVFNERGLLGIALRKINNTDTRLAGNLQVYLYYTEITLTGEPLGNRVYKYLWDGRHLINPSLILDLPATPGPNHNAGKLLIGPDGYLYTVIGDQGRHRGQLQNINGPPPDNTSAIFRVNPETGAPAYGNPFITSSRDDITNLSKSANPLSRYFAYGIRNSFGLAFDPVSGNLWDTENGVNQYDEINLVKPGFNSGWKPIVGPIERTNRTEAELVLFPKSYYSDPKFSWKYTVGVTALGFLSSSKLGETYTNNLFVGDYNTGSLYFFKINKARDAIEFGSNQKELADQVADSPKESSKTVLGTGFDIITDIKTGPDGYLYIASYTEYSKQHPDNVSRIYRIVPVS
jgi:aldose sugar dehydrogenase